MYVIFVIQLLFLLVIVVVSSVCFYRRSGSALRSLGGGCVFIVVLCALELIPHFIWVSKCDSAGLYVYEKRAVEGFYQSGLSAFPREIARYLKSGYKYVETDAPTESAGKYARYELSSGGVVVSYENSKRSKVFVESYNLYLGYRVTVRGHQVVDVGGQILGGVYSYQSDGGWLYQAYKALRNKAGGVEYSCSGSAVAVDVIGDVIPSI